MRVLLTHFGGQTPRGDIGPAGVELSDWLLGLQCDAPSTLPASRALVEERDLAFPPEVETEPCEQKTRRDEPQMHVEQHAERLEVTLEGESVVEVFEVSARGVWSRTERRRCRERCAVRVNASQAHGVRARLRGQVVTRTAVPSAAQAGFRGGGEVAWHPGMGLVRVFPAKANR